MLRKWRFAAAAVLTAAVGLIGAQPASAGPEKGGPPSDPRHGVAANAIYLCPWTSWDGYCATALATVNIRTVPHVRPGTAFATLPVNSDFSIYCWGYGDSVNGDNIWYYGRYFTGIDTPHDWPEGWVTGYYLSTGHDPNPAFVNCGDPLTGVAGPRAR